jgi:hypothetical protein
VVRAVRAVQSASRRDRAAALHLGHRAVPGSFAGRFDRCQAPRTRHKTLRAGRS